MSDDPFNECIHGHDWQYCDECCPLGRERATRQPFTPKIPDRHQNLPSILRGIASDEQIRTVFDLQAMNEAADEIERLRIQHTLHQHAIADYLTDTVTDPFDRQRVAVSRFGKAVAKLTATEPPTEGAA